MDISIIPIGSKMKKTRPYTIISPNEMNQSLNTVIIAPMTTKSKPYPTRIPINHNKKKGWLVLDQIRTIDRQRIVKVLGEVKDKDIILLKSVIKEMLVD